MEQFIEYKRLKKSLNKEEKRDLKDTIFFLRTAMTCCMVREIDKKFKDFLDNNGHPPFYEIVMEVCDEVLLSNKSKFLKFMRDKYKGDTRCFSEVYDECFDWFFMIKATKLFKKRMKEELNG